MQQLRALAGHAVNGGLVADDDDVALRFLQAGQYRPVHTTPDGFRRFGALGPDIRVLLTRCVEFRPADHDFGKRQAVPLAQVLLFQAGHDPGLRAERLRRFNCPHQIAGKHGFTREFRVKGQQRRLHPPDSGKRQVGAAEAPALPQRDVRVPVANQIDFSHPNISAK